MQRRLPKTFAPCMGTMPSERARQENVFLALMRIVLTLVTGRPSAVDEDRLNTLIHNDPRQCTRELANVMNCEHPPSCDICIQWAKLKKSGVWVPHALSQNHKNQRVTICASLLVFNRVAREQQRPFLSCIVTGSEKWYLHANIKKRKEWLSLNKRKICRKCFNFSTWHSIF